MPNLNHFPTNPLARKRSRYECDAMQDEADVFSEVVDGTRANICPKCSLPCTDGHKALQCYTCDKWHHNKCVGINDKAYDMISKLDSDRGIEWLCHSCKGEKDKLKSDNLSMKKIIEELSNDNKTLQNNYDELKKRLDDLKVEIKTDVMREVREEIQSLRNLNNNSTNNINGGINLREEIAKAIKVEEENKLRKNNLIIYNLEESKKDNINDQNTDDADRIKELFRNTIKVSSFEIVKIFRIGRKTETVDTVRQRPMLIKFSEESEKWSILKGAKELRNAEGWRKKIGISLDLCKEDREKDKKLRAELKAKRDNNERGWYIRAGKLCKRDF